MSVKFNDFETDISNSFAIPPVREHYKEELLQHLESGQIAAPNFFSQIQIGWKFTAAALVMLIVVIFALGPNKVLAQIQTWLSYIPNRGYVDLNAPMRVLREPVKLTRDGVTVEIYSALLTNRETFMEYSVFGLSREAFPKQENIPGCQERPFLILPDGTTLQQNGNAYPAIPTKVESATLVIPCLSGTLPGKAPENWELPLHFVDSSQAPVSLPVVQDTPLQISPEPGSENPQVTSENPGLGLIRAIETPKGYILIGTAPSNVSHTIYRAIRSTPDVTDANGKEVATRIPIGDNLLSNEDLSAISSQGLDYWTLEFDIAGLTFPITISSQVQELDYIGPSQSIDLTIELGQAPPLSQPIEVNKELQIADQKFTLLSITPLQDGYSFSIQFAGNLSSVGVEVVGGQALGAGGGLNPETNIQNTSIVYEKRPKSPLTLHFSNLAVEGKVITLKTTWQPQVAHTPLPVDNGPQTVCFSNSSIDFSQIKEFNSAGWALRSDAAAPGSKKITLVNLQTNEETQLTVAGTQAQFSPDGKIVYYTQAGWMYAYNLETKAAQRTEVFTTNRFEIAENGENLGYMATWADGSSEIDITKIKAMGLYVVLKGLGAEIVGWSADSNNFYYLVPSLDRDIWKLMRYDFTQYSSSELFSITDASYKLVSAHISPDGQWVTYRGRDYNTLHLIGIDGQNPRLLLENTPILGLRWISSNHLLLQTKSEQSGQNLALLINIEDCSSRQIQLPNGTVIEDVHIP
jgi:hypothetical protein